MNRSKFTLPGALNLKLIYSLTGIILLTGAIKLFIFSAYEGEDDERFREIFNKHYKIFALNIPGEITFAGEKAPIHTHDARERLDRELLINTYWQSQTLLFIKRSNRWFPVIEPILKKHKVPDDFKYLALIESGLTNAVSPAGATGFWQFMKPAAEKYGLEITNQVDERYHVEKSTEAACKYLKEAYRMFGSWALAAAAYNAGMGGVARQIERQKANNYYDLLFVEETSRYVFRILAVKEILSNPKKYGFHFRKKDLYPAIETYTVEIDTGVTHFADFAAGFGITYKTLKDFNPWLRDNFLANRTGKVYQLKIPKKESENMLNDKSIFEEGPLMADSLRNPDKDTLITLPADTPGSEQAPQEE